MNVTELIDQKYEEDLQRLREFRLLDDDFMTKCFEGDPKYIQFVLRIVLEIPDLEVVDVRTQVFVENLLNRSVRLDVVATDSTGRKINVEIQRSDRGAGRKRARYNSSMMDANLLQKSAKFEELPESYVIFITEHDVIGKGRPVYHIERCILDTSEIFNDGSHILYVNGAYRDETPLGKLMHDFSCSDPADMNYKVLAERVRFFKESREGVAIMCRAMEDMRNQTLLEGIREGRKQGKAEGRIEGKREGRKQGRREGMRDVADRMLTEGKYSLEEIVNLTRLTLGEVKELQAGQGG